MSDTASTVKRTLSRKRSHDSVTENATADAETRTNCKARALTPNHVRPYSSNALTSSAIRRAQRRRLPSRRLLDDADMYNIHKSLLGRSPATKYGNCSNIKETCAAYITPNYMRVNGKLKSGKQYVQFNKHACAIIIRFLCSFERKRSTTTTATTSSCCAKAFCA